MQPTPTQAADAAKAADAKDRFRRAWRMTRLAFRGLRREALKSDLRVAPDYSPDCRRSNASVKIVEKVAAAIGWSSDLNVCWHAQAVRLALGELIAREPRIPAPLDFDAWLAIREFHRQVRSAA